MKFLAWFLGIMVFLFLLSCLGIHVLPWDAVFALVAGWILFIARTLPKVQWSGGMVLSAAVYVVLLGVGGQLFLRWLYSQTSGARWRVGWTLRAFAVLLLMFAVGTAAFGVVQHVKTLAGSQEIFIPYIEHSDRRYCAENLTDIGQALMRYARDHRGSFLRTCLP